MNLLKNMKFQEVMAPVSAASDTDSNSDRLDMANWDGVIFIVPLTDSVATGVATLTIEQNTADSDSGMAALSGATATATCTVNDDLNNTLLIVEVYKPRERYVQGVVTSATANIAFGNMIAIQYRGRKGPVTQPASVQASTLVASPAEA
jgi:hypothetical protein